MRLRKTFHRNRRHYNDRHSRHQNTHAWFTQKAIHSPYKLMLAAGFLLASSYYLSNAIMAEKETQPDDKSDQAVKPRLDKEDWVRIRVWHPTAVVNRRYLFDVSEEDYAKLRAGKPVQIDGLNSEDVDIAPYGVGHASVELCTGEYLSYWPGKPIKNLLDPLTVGKKVPVNRDLDRTVFLDTKSEGFDPQTDIVLYSLDTSSIQEKVHLLDEDGSYALVGPHLFNWFGAESCASAAYGALESGNIFGLADECSAINSLLNSFNPVKPTDVAFCVRAAKKQEEALFPETKGWDEELKNQDENYQRHSL